MSNKLWDGRFSEPTDRMVEHFTASIETDSRLYAYDIEGSCAHARMMAKVGVISEAEASELVQGLATVKQEIERGQFRYDESLEDIHMHIEARLGELVGNVARKLHTGRSRNDQVALDMRLFLRHETRQIIDNLKHLRRKIVDMASRHADVVMPGYTHLQRAQPVLFAHHLMAYYEMFTRDARRFADVLKRIDVMPLGSAALAGTTYPIDREYTARLLGFSAISANSMDAVGDRDFAIEFLAAASIGMMHFSRLSEDVILWSSAEFGFIELSDAFTTGSSIMPQKKNPDVAELVRGKTGRVYGDLFSLLTLMKSLPMTYNRDMQEDKQPLFDGVDTLKACLAIYSRMLPKAKVNSDRMQVAATRGYLNATDLADYLVNKGVPFREAHEIVGKAVAYALGEGQELHDLSLEALKKVSAVIEGDVFEVLTLKHMVNRRQCAGATGSSAVKAAIDTAKRCLAAEADMVPAE